MDPVRMEEAIRAFLAAIGERFPGDDLELTPRRVARAWSEELLAGYAVDPAAELSYSEAEGCYGPVLLRDVRFCSTCVHHLLPFFGRAHVAYLPKARLAGLSTIGRMIDGYARRLQIQERLTQQILSALVRVLEPQGALVVLEAEHTCLSLRGARKEASRFVTLAAAGVYESDAARRHEVLQLLTPVVPAGEPPRS